MENQNDNVVNLDFYRNSERINGIKMNLGRMALEELQVVFENCQQREDDARTDRIIVQDYIETYSQRHPDGNDIA